MSPRRLVSTISKVLDIIGTSNIKNRVNGIVSVADFGLMVSLLKRGALNYFIMLFYIISDKLSITSLC